MLACLLRLAMCQDWRAGSHQASSGFSANMASNLVPHGVFIKRSALHTYLSTTIALVKQFPHAMTRSLSIVDLPAPTIECYQSTCEACFTLPTLSTYVVIAMVLLLAIVPPLLHMQCCLQCIVCMLFSAICAYPQAQRVSCTTESTPGLCHHWLRNHVCQP